MSLARRLLIRAPQPWLAEQFRRRSFANAPCAASCPAKTSTRARRRRKVHRRQHRRRAHRAGEQVTSRDEADAVRRHYLQVLAQVERRRLGSHISVKVTHLGSRPTPPAATAPSPSWRRARRRRDRCCGSTWKIALRGSDARRLPQRARSGADVGIALQPICDAPPRISRHCCRSSVDPPGERRVQRAGPHRVPKKSDVDAAYFDLAGRFSAKPPRARHTDFARTTSR